MEFRLVAVRPFAAHRKGDVISDPSEIAKILAGPDTANVVRVAVPPAAPPATTGTPTGEH